MLQGGHPLREKLTLFWHNHFATSLAKVQDPVLMFRQNGLLREHALGRFGPLLQAISRDPAMLVWLDSNSNVKGKPNENYARELMELFSLGVGNYTEKDIREAARAFTGWRTDGTGFAFDARLHDGGTKTVLGQTGTWDGGDVVRIVLEQPAAARFLVRKLYRYLVSETATPPDALLEPLCESFRQSDYDIAGLVRTILASRHFYSAHAFRQRIKGPVEYVLGAVQAVYRRYARTTDYRPLPQQVLVGRLGGDGPVAVRPAERQGLAGRHGLAEHLDAPRARQLRRGPGDGHALARRRLRSRRRAAGGWRRSWTTAQVRRPVPADMPEEPAPPRAFDPARILDEEG